MPFASPLDRSLTVVARFRLQSRIGLVLLAVSLAASGCSSPIAKVEPVYFPPPPATAHAVHLISFNSLDALVPAKRSWVEAFRGISPSPHITTPGGIAYLDDSLYICDVGQNVVHRWNLTTGSAKRFGSSGDTKLLVPVDVAVDAAGVVYVADTGLARTVAYDAAGKWHASFSPPARADYRPVAVAVRNGELFVTDIRAHQIDVFSIADGTLIGSSGGPGNAAGQFFFPLDVEATGDGRIYVADTMNSRVQVLDGKCDPLLNFGQPGTRYGDMGKPRGVAVGPDGVIFVADEEFARVHLFDQQGRLLMLLGEDDGATGATPMPTDVAVAGQLPERLTELVPGGFRADYFLFVANKVGNARLSLFAVGLGAEH